MPIKRKATTLIFILTQKVLITVKNMGRERKGPPSAKIVFEGELEKRVEALRIHYGIKNYTELIRMLITTRYDELRKTGEI
jgi:hypothetical protein